MLTTSLSLSSPLHLPHPSSFFFFFFFSLFPSPSWQARQLAEQWCWERWNELHGGPAPRVQLLDPDPGGRDNWKPDKMPYLASLRLHAGLPKAQSSILTQVRTGKIGLAAFLCKRRAPGFPTAGLQLWSTVGNS